MKNLFILPILGLILIAVSCKPLPPFHTDTVPNKSSGFSKVFKKLSLPGDAPVNSTRNPLIVFQTKMPKFAIASTTNVYATNLCRLIPFSSSVAISCER